MEIDLNADLGEWSSDGTPEAARAEQNDAALLGVVTSANIACGGHAGDSVVMRITCAAAAARRVAIGAHVSYDDRANFGRHAVAIPTARLVQDLVVQIGALVHAAGQVGTTVRYVKPHGALYHQCGHDHDHAGAVVRAIVLHDGDLGLVVAPGSVLERVAGEQAIVTVAEGFVDRAYAPSGELVPRAAPGAVHRDAEACVSQAVSIATLSHARAVDGSTVSVPARTLCVHGDTPDSLAIATDVRAALGRSGASVRSPW